ncbi:hypothetical protein LINPERPRIM_LOCUS39267 [Linum perenne]
MLLSAYQWTILGLDISYS